MPRANAAAHSGARHAVILCTLVGANQGRAMSTFTNPLKQRLAEQLATMFPNAVCRSWSWGHVRVVHDQDSAGLPLARFHLVRTD